MLEVLKTIIRISVLVCMVSIFGFPHWSWIVLFSVIFLIFLIVLFMSLKHDSKTPEKD